MMSVLVAIDRLGKKLGMDRTHRAVQFYAQIMHESGEAAPGDQAGLQA